MRTADLSARLHKLLDETRTRRGNGGSACRLVVAAMTDALNHLEAGRVFSDEEFVTTLLTRLARRFLDAVGDRPAGAVPLAWRVLREHRPDARVSERRLALAAANAVVNHDLPSAVVSTCTLQGRVPCPLERADSEAFVAPSPTTSSVSWGPARSPPPGRGGERLGPARAGQAELPRTWSGWLLDATSPGVARLR